MERTNSPQFIEATEPSSARIWFYFDGRRLHFYVRPLNGGDRKTISFRLYLSWILKSASAVSFKRPKQSTLLEMEKLPMEGLFRQGDVIFKRIDRLPKGKRTRRCNGVLAEGEVTGHKHAVADLDAAEVLEIGEGLFLSVTARGASIVHDEHKTISLPKGDYQVVIQREYSPEEIRNVAD